MAVVLLLAGGVGAIEAPALGLGAGTDGECDNRLTQSALNGCADAAFQDADAALGSVYVRLAAELSAEGRGALRAAQDAWAVYRARQCAFVSGGVSGGSIAPMIYSQCAQALTEARTEALAALLDCEEGDFSCPR